MTLQDTHKKLPERRLQNILLNFLCILIAGSGLIWVANYFWKYIHYEITNDAFIDQYVSPLNIHASGYIKYASKNISMYTRRYTADTGQP